MRIARIASLAAALAAACVSFAALAQTYPTKPVRIVVENRAGAGGIIGSELVAKSQPDGYTLLLNSAGTHAILPNVDRKLPYDPQKDFTAIANLAEGFTFIAAHPSLNVTDVAGLVKLAKEKPNTIGYATSGIGTYGHFAGELFQIGSGTVLVHVAYKGSGPALTDLAAGHVPLMIAGETVELAKVGKIRIIATTNERRWVELPDVKTMKEQGFPQFTVHSWIGLVGPANMPPDIVAKLNAAAGKAINDPKVQEQLVKFGVLPTFSSPSEFAQRMRADRDAYAEIVSKANLKFE